VSQLTTQITAIEQEECNTYIPQPYLDEEEISTNKEQTSTKTKEMETDEEPGDLVKRLVSKGLAKLKARSSEVESKKWQPIPEHFPKNYLNKFHPAHGTLSQEINRLDTAVSDFNIHKYDTNPISTIKSLRKPTSTLFQPVEPIPSTSKNALLYSGLIKLPVKMSDASTMVETEVTSPVVKKKKISKEKRKRQTAKYNQNLKKRAETDPLAKAKIQERKISKKKRQIWKADLEEKKEIKSSHESMAKVADFIKESKDKDLTAASKRKLKYVEIVGTFPTEKTEKRTQQTYRKVASLVNEMKASTSKNVLRGADLPEPELDEVQMRKRIETGYTFISLKK
jgi:hypothetical protein